MRSSDWSSDVCSSDLRTLVSILLDTLLRSKLKDLAAFAAGTDAAAFISTEGERTSAGIQAELASVMRSFSYLDDPADGFSNRHWEIGRASCRARVCE